MKLHFQRNSLLLLTILFVFYSCAKQDNFSEKIHPAFDIDQQELEQLISTLPRYQQYTILQRPQVFLELVKQVLELPASYTILVDKNHGLDMNYVPSRLVSLDNYPEILTFKPNMQLSADVIPALLALIEAAKQDGIELLVSSAYRSFSYQEDLFNYWSAQANASEVEHESAIPGHSQHQLGTTIDFAPVDPVFAETKAYAWLQQHAADFGFSLSYPEHSKDFTGYTFESWHWRFIHPSTTAIQKNFFDNSQQCCLAFFHIYADYLRELMLQNTQRYE